MKAKKLFAGITALLLTAGFIACSKSDEDASKTAASGTTAVTVEINTEALKEEEQSELEIAMAKLPDKELENKEIR